MEESEKTRSRSKHGKIDVTVITREMMLELFDRIIIGEKCTPNGEPRVIQLIYKVDTDSVL